MLCLLEWLMVIPQEDVLKCHVQGDGGLSYFGLAMKVNNFHLPIFVLNLIFIQKLFNTILILLKFLLQAFNECCRQPNNEHESHHVEHKPINIDQLFIGENHPSQIECVHNDLQEAHDLSSYDSSRFKIFEVFL